MKKLIASCLLGMMMSSLSGSLLAAEGPANSPRRFHIIYNPTAGKKHTPALLAEVTASLTQQGIEVTTQATEYAGHAREIARTFDGQGYEGLCALGGDGTVNQVANGLLARPDGGLPLCVIPGGTGNAFSRDLGITSSAQAVAAIIAGSVRPVDVGEVHYQSADGVAASIYMINMVGLGIGVDANRRAEKMRALGPMRYDIGILVEILKKKAYHASVQVTGDDNRETDYSLILVQNTKHGGNGLVLAPNAEVNDGFLDLVLAPRLAPTKMLGLLDKLKKDGSHISDPRVTYKKVTGLEITSSEPLAVNIDGENCAWTPLRIEAQADKLWVFW